MTTIKDVPAVPSSIEPITKGHLQRLTDAVRSLTKLANGGSFGLGGSGSGGLVLNPPGPPGEPGPPGTPGGEVEPDLTPPPTPTGFEADSGLTIIIAKWDPPIYSMGHGHGQTNLYGAKWPTSQVDPPVFADAVQVLQVPGPAQVIANFATEPATRWCLWLTWQTRDGVESEVPAGGINGLTITTGQDPSLLLKVLADAIRRSELYADLGEKIDLIDADFTVPNSPAYRVKVETDARIAAIAQEVLDRSAADDAVTTLLRSEFEADDTAVYTNAVAYVQGYTYSGAGVDAAIALSGSTLTSAFQAGDAAVYSNAQSYVQGYSYSKTTVDSAIAAQSSALTAAFTAADGATLTTAQSYVQTYAYARAQVDAALVALEDELRAEIQNNSGGVSAAYVQNYTFSKAESLAAEAAQTTAIQSMFTAADQNQLTAINANLANNFYTRTQADSAIAQQVNAMSATLASNFESQITWDFQFESIGWFVHQGTITPHQNSIVYATQGFDTHLAVVFPSPINGNIWEKVRMRLRHFGGSIGSWEGNLYYSTAAHAWDGQYRKQIPKPATIDTGGGWLTIEWDMTALTAGGTDYLSSMIYGLRFDLVNDNSGSPVFEIDWVSVGRYAPSTSSSRIAQIQTTIVDGLAAQTTRSDLIVASVNNVQGAIQNEAITRATRDDALALQISTVQSAVAVRPNLLVNGGFERGLDGWTGNLAGWGVADTFWGRVAQIFGAPPDGQILSERFAVFAGATYTIAGDSALFANAGHCFFDIVFYGAAENFLGESGEAALFATHDFSEGNANRNAHAAQGVAPAGAVWARARFVWSGVVASSFLGCRYIKVERGPLPATPYTAEPTAAAIAASVQVESSTRAQETGALFASYTVKVDVNGYVSGYGIAATGNGGPVTSSFIVRANSFAIAAPSGPGIAPIVPFVVRTTPGEENGVPIPVGIYMDSAYIVNLTTLWARFGTLVADSIRGGQISATNLTVGDGTVGGILKSANFISGSSGWILRPNGTAQLPAAYIVGRLTAAQLETEGLHVRGGKISGGAITQWPNWPASGQTGFYLGPEGLMLGNFNDGSYFVVGANGEVYAPGFTIQIGQGATFNGNVNARGSVRGGAFTGYAWPSAGQTGYYLGPEGLLIGNANDGKYFQVDAQGNVYAPGFSIVNGSATFSGSLAAGSVTTTHIANRAVTNTLWYLHSGSVASVFPVLTETSDLLIMGTVTVPSPGFSQTLSLDGVALRTETVVNGVVCTLCAAANDVPPGTHTVTMQGNGSGTNAFVQCAVFKR